MSYLLESGPWAWNQRLGSAERKLVLLYLAHEAYGSDYKLEAFSYHRISKYCSMSKKAVVKHIEKLIDGGYLVKITDKEKDEWGEWVYRLDLSKIGSLK